MLDSFSNFDENKINLINYRKHSGQGEATLARPSAVYVGVKMSCSEKRFVCWHRLSLPAFHMVVRLHLDWEAAQEDVKKM